MDWFGSADCDLDEGEPQSISGREDKALRSEIVFRLDLLLLTSAANRSPSGIVK